MMLPLLASMATATPQFEVKWTTTDIARGRLSLIISRDLSDEPRLTVGSSFTNAGQIFAFDITDAGAGTASFPSPAQASFPFDTVDELPAGAVSIQAVLTPYTQYNRSDGASLWLPGWNSLTYSEDYDSYGWANVTTPFGGQKGLTQPKVPCTLCRTPRRFQSRTGRPSSSHLAKRCRRSHRHRWTLCFRSTSRCDRECSARFGGSLSMSVLG